MPAENCFRKSNYNFDCTSLDNAILVHNVTEYAHRPTNDNLGEKEHVVSSSEREHSPTQPSTTINGMQSIREQLIEHNIPGDIADVVMCSWRTGTQKQYDVYIKKWQAFCFEEKINSLQPSVNNVLKFLHGFHINNRSYSLINTARSALSSYLMSFQFPGQFTMSNHPFIIRYLRGVFNCCKPAPRYQETWDVAPVLKYIELLFPLEKLSLKDLTMKLVMLLALTSGQRCQTLIFLNTGAMSVTPDYYLFHIKEHVKQDRPGKLLSSVFVRKYPKEQLCTYTTLQHYIDRTGPFRNAEHAQLMLSYVKPHHPVGTSSIGRWIKTVLSASGIDINKFKPHSTRAAAVSKASKSITTDEILQHIGWSQESTFQKYYNKPICNDIQFDRAVLE